MIDALFLPLTEALELFAGENVRVAPMEDGLAGTELVVRQRTDGGVTELTTAHFPTGSSGER